VAHDLSDIPGDTPSGTRATTSIGVPGPIGVPQPPTVVLVAGTLIVGVVARGMARRRDRLSGGHPVG